MEEIVSKQVFIMRGLPGSGKSTRAKELVEGKFGLIFCADDYFIGRDGVYRFDYTKLEANHDRCFRDFLRALKAGISPLVVDNVNARQWQYRRYVARALGCGYKVTIVTMEAPEFALAADRNHHGVPVSTIQKLAHFWEPDLEV